MQELAARVDDIERLERVARDGIGTDEDIDDLGKRAERCLRETITLPE